MSGVHPLSDIVIFPGNLLPLHNFESRYKEMLEDAMQGDQLIAMATLLPGFEHEYYSRPPIAAAVCIGRVMDYEETPSGTYNLTLLGLKRAEVEYEIEPVRSFRRAQVKLLEKPESEAGEAEHQLALQLADRLRDALPSAEELVEQVAEGEISLEYLTDIVATHLPLPTDSQLEFLAEVDSVVRARRLLSSLPA